MQATEYCPKSGKIRPHFDTWELFYSSVESWANFSPLLNTHYLSKGVPSAWPHHEGFSFQRALLPWFFQCALPSPPGYLIFPVWDTESQGCKACFALFHMLPGWTAASKGLSWKQEASAAPAERLIWSFFRDSLLYESLLRLTPPPKEARIMPFLQRLQQLRASPEDWKLGTHACKNIQQTTMHSADLGKAGGKKGKQKVFLNSFRYPIKYAD